MTYQQAYDKIIQAYFKNEIRPYEARYCICGTLCDNSAKWRNVEYKGILSDDVHKNYRDYTGREYADIERALLLPLRGYKIDEYEEKLFLGMSAALDVLKQIHIERGEVIDEAPVFTKRELVKQ